MVPNSLGWYEGFRLLVGTDPTGVITGFGFCGASATNQQVAETFFAVRHRPNPRLSSVGSPAAGPYVADKGFEGEENHRRWLDRYGTRIIHLGDAGLPSQRTATRFTPRPSRQTRAHLRRSVRHHPGGSAAASMRLPHRRRAPSCPPQVLR